MQASIVWFEWFDLASNHNNLANKNHYFGYSFSLKTKQKKSVDQIETWSNCIKFNFSIVHSLTNGQRRWMKSKSCLAPFSRRNETKTTVFGIWPDTKHMHCMFHIAIRLIKKKRWNIRFYSEAVVILRETNWNYANETARKTNKHNMNTWNMKCTKTVKIDDRIHFK